MASTISTVKGASSIAQSGSSAFFNS
jgi:hypothetical protein